MFDSEHAVSTAHSTDRVWRFSLHCRYEYESFLRVQTILQHFLAVRVAHESDVCRWLAQEAAHACRCDSEGLVFKWEGFVDGVACTFDGPLNKK